jgi:predicted RNA-binding Zn ribbon-like protein
VKPLFLAGHPAIDFLNTSLAPGGQPTELIGDGRALLAWLVDAGLVDAATASRLSRRFGEEALDTAAAEARRFREWARAWILRWQQAPDGHHEAELRRLNGLLEREAIYREVVAGAQGRTLIERRRLDSAEQLLGLVALQVAQLVTDEEPALIKACAGPDCTLWFLDRTKAHRRLFCSAAACGNRAKVAAFRERQRAGDGG